MMNLEFFEDIKAPRDLDLVESKPVAFVDKEICIGCGSCANQCPVSAISIDEVAEVDPSICINCGSCMTSCPVTAISEVNVAEDMILENISKED